MRKLVLALFLGLVMVTACQKEAAVQPTRKAIQMLMVDTNGGIGGSGGEDRPKPTGGN